MAQWIFVTEDDEGIREMIQIALESLSYQVSVFATAEETLAAVIKETPDLFIFDIMLPGMDGITAVQQLRTRSQTARTPILFLTAKDTEMDKVKGLDAGADDYLAKPFGIMELSARVRALLRRSVKQDSVIIEGDITINCATREAFLHGNPIELTYKEFELLSLLMRNKNRVVPREELLNSVWGYDFLGETRTLDTHIKSLRSKLHDTPENPQYIHTIRNVGYRFQEGKA